jgi:adenylate cyclase
MRANDEKKLISSIDLLAQTGISRATLNNYIKMGIVPQPFIRKPDDPSIKAKQIGYFHDSVLDRIEKIILSKKEGKSMKEICSLLPCDNRDDKESSGQFSPESAEGDLMLMDNDRHVDIHEKEEYPDDNKLFNQEEKREDFQDNDSQESKDIHLTVQEILYPSYLINNKFEIEWINPEKIIFRRNIRSMKIAEERSIFRLLIDMGISQELNRRMMDFHMAIFARRFQKNEIEKLYPSISRNEMTILGELYDRLSDPSSAVNVEDYINLPGDPENLYQAHCIQFREGILCVFAPAGKMIQGVLQLLSRRGRLIRDLLRNRLPTQIHFAVMVADLQDSVRICAELPPEEYFTLINQIWTCMEGCFKKYYGTYGKHTGDGMVYYFLRDNNSNYIMNAINCAMDLRKSIKELSNEWKINKGWFNDLFLNIGINEGEEYFGMIPAAPSIEFTALGDSVNYAGRLSDLARYGGIWTTKNLINHLTDEERKTLRYGIRKKQQDREVLIENVFSRVMDLIPPDSAKATKFMDIATLPVTEVLELR